MNREEILKKSRVLALVLCIALEKKFEDIFYFD